MKISDLSDAPSHKDTSFVKDYGYPLYIGIDSIRSRGFHEFKNNSRPPRDTIKVLHNLANHLSMKKLGVNIRQGIFSTKDSSHAGSFGEHIMRFVPNDGYEMFCNPEVEDFTVHSTHGSEYKKIDRNISGHIAYIIGKVFADTSYYSGRKYINFINNSSIDFDKFNIVEVSKPFFEDNYFSEKGITSQGIKDKFYKELENLWMIFYNDVKSYVDGLIKVTDLNAIPKNVEIITFPYNGFWMI